MFYVITYYLNKFKYVLAILLSLSLLAVVIYLNRSELINSYEEYVNKVELKPNNYSVEIYTGESLDNLLVGTPFTGTMSRDWAPSSMSEAEKEVFRDELKKDPDRPYRIMISWSAGVLSNEDVLSLAELISYHYNKNMSLTKYIVNVPTPEELKEYDKDVVYKTDDKGNLYLNLHIDEVNSSTGEVKSYVYTFKLHYDGTGLVKIR